jgi:RNA polymerase sigma-70 factor (ECF subfamily)
VSILYQEGSVVDRMVVGIVRIHAARLIGRYGFTTADRDDISQEILRACIDSQRRYNPAKSSRRTFLCRVAGNQVANLRDSQSAACRDYRLCTNSLDGPVPIVASKSITLGDTMSADARVGRSALSSWECEQLRIDVARVISTLPPELAAIARLLQSIAVVEVSRLLGMPRATLYRHIARIRQAFATAGLRGYLRREEPESLILASQSKVDVMRLAASCASERDTCLAGPVRRTTLQNVTGADQRRPQSSPKSQRVNWLQRSSLRDGWDG